MNSDEEDGISKNVDDPEYLKSVQPIELPSESLSKVNRCATTNKNKLSSLQKYNIIVKEAKILASIVSAEDNKCFTKSKNHTQVHPNKYTRYEWRQT